MRSLARRKAPIKAVIIDQNFIAGIGSMYADEALFAAGINPRRPANSLTPEEIKHLPRVRIPLEWAKEGHRNRYSIFRIVWYTNS